MVVREFIVAPFSPIGIFEPCMKLTALFPSVVLTKLITNLRLPDVFVDWTFLPLVSTSRFTYNINSRNINNDINNSYYTYNNNQNYENINKNIIYQSQNINPNDNQNISLLNQSNPLPYYQTYSNENNISYNSYNDNRFIRLNSRLDEINAKINKEKMEKENLILSKISTTEILLDNNNENRMRKIKEIKNSISDISLLFEQIKQSTKQRNKQSDEILEIFENKFNK